MTVGPWRPIYLKSYSAAIEKLKAQTKVDQNLDMSLNASVHLYQTSTGVRNISFALIDSEGKVIKTSSQELSDTGSPTQDAHLSWNFAEGETELWWPFNYGKQTLYTLQVRLHAVVSLPWFILGALPYTAPRLARTGLFSTKCQSG